MQVRIVSELQDTPCEIVETIKSLRDFKRLLIDVRGEVTIKSQSESNHDYDIDMVLK